MPCFSARPERGRICISNPGGISTRRPRRHERAVHPVEHDARLAILGAQVGADVGAGRACGLIGRHGPSPLRMSAPRAPLSRENPDAWRAHASASADAGGRAAGRPRPCPSAASSSAPAAVIRVTAFSAPPMIPVSGRHVVRHDPVAALAGPLGGGIGHHVVGLGGEADDKARARPSLPATVARMSGFSRELQHRRRAGAVLLDLPVRGIGHPPVGDGGGEDRGIGGQGRLDRVQHLRRGLDRNDPHARRRRHAAGPVTKVTCAPSAASAAAMRRTLRARRAVGDVAHRVDRLVRRARGDEDVAAPSTGRRPAPPRSRPRSRAVRPSAPVRTRRRPCRPRSGRQPDIPSPRRVARLRRVAGWFHIRTFIAGAISTALVGGQQQRRGQIIGPALPPSSPSDRPSPAPRRSDRPRATARCGPSRPRRSGRTGRV